MMKAASTRPSQPQIATRLWRALQDPATAARLVRSAKRRMIVLLKAFALTVAPGCRDAIRSSRQHDFGFHDVLPDAESRARRTDGRMPDRTRLKHRSARLMTCSGE